MPIQITIPWKGKTLAGSVHYPPMRGAEGEKFPLILICHGFIGSRIGVDRLFVKAANELSLAGNVVVRFDYSGCGESEGEYGKTGLDELIEQTIRVMDYSNHLFKVNERDITLLGHSLGGATAVLTAARDKRVKKLILWSSVGNPLKDISNIVGRKRMETLRRAPFLDYQGFPLYENFFASLGRFNPIEEASFVQGDVLLVHGTKDSEIPITYSQQFYDVFSKRNHCTLKLIEGANHTFSNLLHFHELMITTLEWTKGQVRCPNAQTQS